MTVSDSAHNREETGARQQKIPDPHGTNTAGARTVSTSSLTSGSMPVSGCEEQRGQFLGSRAMRRCANGSSRNTGPMPRSSTAWERPVA